MPKTNIQKRKLVGKVTHFFSNINVAVIKLDGNLKVGDVIEIDNKGETFEQKVNSMQVEHESVKEAKKGKEVGLKVENPVKVNALVYLK